MKQPQRRVWYRVNAPISWRPKVGEELVGTYLSSKVRIGEYGEYRVYFIKSRSNIFYVSGSVCDNLFSLIAPNAKVKLLFRGTREATEGRVYKLYELYTEEAVEAFKVVA